MIYNISDEAIRGPGPELRAPARIIGNGAEATIQVDVTWSVVTKVYKKRPGATGAFDAAEREYRMLQRFAHALRAVPGVSCPAPLALIEDIPCLCMRFVDGVPLHDYAACTTLREEELSGIAERLAAGLRVYLDIAGEPYHDFCMQNALYRPAQRGIVLLDLGIPESQRPLHGRYTDAQLSVGNFLGCALYELARPARIRPGPARRQFARIYLCLHEQLLRDGVLRVSDLPWVEEVARHTYRRLARNGGALRRGWYLAFVAVNALRLARTRRMMFNP